MKRYLAVAAVLTLGLVVCFASGISLAQEEEKETEYSWGTVSSISSDQITVKEHDYASENEVEVTYTIDPKVELKNVNSLKDIAVGDSVDIDYVVKDGKKVAMIIDVEKPSYEEESSYEEEYTPSETYEEELE